LNFGDLLRTSGDRYRLSEFFKFLQEFRIHPGSDGNHRPGKQFVLARGNIFPTDVTLLVAFRFEE